MTKPEALAARHFDEKIGPEMRQDGMPEDGVAHLRQKCIEGAVANPAAVRQLREIYEEQP